MTRLRSRNPLKDPARRPQQGCNPGPPCFSVGSPRVPRASGEAPRVKSAQALACIDNTGVTLARDRSLDVRAAASVTRCLQDKTAALLTRDPLQDRVPGPPSLPTGNPCRPTRQLSRGGTAAASVPVGSVGHARQQPRCQHEDLQSYRGSLVPIRKTHRLVSPPVCSAKDGLFAEKPWPRLSPAHPPEALPRTSSRLWHRSWQAKRATGAGKAFPGGTVGADTAMASRRVSLGESATRPGAPSHPRESWARALVSASENQRPSPHGVRRARSCKGPSRHRPPYPGL